MGDLAAIVVVVSDDAVAVNYLYLVIFFRRGNEIFEITMCYDFRAQLLLKIRYHTILLSNLRLRTLF